MKILLPVDGSAQSLDAVKHALTLVAEGLRADFVLVNVQPPATLYEVVVAHDPVVLDQVRGAAGADLLAPAEALLQAAGVSWESEVASGEPAHLLVELVENYGCDAVIMGSNGGSSLRSALLGSVSSALLRNCPVPVTVVRQPEVANEAVADDTAA